MRVGVREVGEWGVAAGKPPQEVWMARANVISRSDRRGIRSQNPRSRFKSQFCPVLCSMTSY